MPFRPLLVVAALALVGAACSLPPASPSTSALRYLVHAPPAAALDSVAAWAAGSSDLVVDRTPAGLAIRDRRPRQDNLATVTAQARADGLTEVSVASVYVVAPAFRDLGAAAYYGRKSRGEAAFALPLADSPACFSVEEWRARSAEREAPAGAAESEPAVEVSPELIGGMAGLQGRVQYPGAMRRAGMAGAVVVEFVVGETGEVECAQAVSSPHPAFSEAALAAVLGSAFTPGTQGGRPVPVQLTVPVVFALQ